MADAKISALTNLTAADPTNDMIPIVDVSDTPPASGNTKRISINNILSSSPTASGALTVTGLVTAGSATITGALGAAGLNVTGATIPANGVYLGSANNLSFSAASTLEMTLNSTGLGVGVASPAFKLSAAGVSQFYADSDGIYASGNLSPDLYTIGVNYYNAGGTEGVKVAARPSWKIEHKNSSDALAYLDIGFRAASAAASAFTSRFKIDGTGNVGIGVTPAGTGGCLQLKSGITFPATQVASSDANTLDDYEEGTWTGTLAGGTTNPTIPVTATGRYTKVGRQVSVQIAFETVSNVGASGSISITGLPFANAALRVIGTAGAFTGATFSGTLISQIESSASSILFYGVISNSAWIAATHNPVAGAFFWANLTYTV